MARLGIQTLGYSESLLQPVFHCIAHGAVSIWRRGRFSEIYESHPGLPIGEDGWAGRQNLLAGYTMKHDSGCIFQTEVPPNLFPCGWLRQGNKYQLSWQRAFHRGRKWLFLVSLALPQIFRTSERISRTFGKRAVPSENRHGAQTYSFLEKEDMDQEKEVFPVLAGYGSPDLFNQRAMRCNMNSPRRLWCHIKLFFSYGWDQFLLQPFLRALVFNILFRIGLLEGI